MARFPQLDLVTILAEPNPHIDLRIEAYEKSTRNFLKAVANYKNRAIATITDRRNNQAAERKKVLEKINLIEKETNQCKLREIELVSELEREKEERKEAELSVAAFKRQLASLNERCTSIEALIEEYRAITTNSHREKNKERSILSTYTSRLSHELHLCEQKLFCVVEGVEKNRLLVRFSHIDPSDPEREFSLVLDVSSQVYKVVTSSPPLLSLPILVDSLNDSRDIYEFIREVRAAFVNLNEVSA